MSLDNIRIVLVRTSHPGNIGACARAMKNMGIKNLYLVEPLDFPSEIATKRASGAMDVLNNAVICASLNEAIADCHYIAATTARKRSLNWESLKARSGAEKLYSWAENSKTAIVFGPERTGLSNEEIQRCHLQIHFPVNPEFTSMNLAAAVMLMSYELNVLHQASDENQHIVTEDLQAPAQRVEGFIEHLHSVMKQIGFLNNKPSAKLVGRIRRLFHRAAMSEDDINILRGVLSGVESAIKHEKPP